MTTTPTPAPPESPERPSLVAEACRPDVLVRLRAILPAMSDAGALYPGEKVAIVDAIATIEALRAANQRHCDDERLLKEARARVAELEAVVKAVLDLPGSWKRAADAPRPATASPSIIAAGRIIDETLRLCAGDLLDAINTAPPADPPSTTTAAQQTERAS